MIQLITKTVRRQSMAYFSAFGAIGTAQVYTRPMRLLLLPPLLLCACLATAREVRVCVPEQDLARPEQLRAEGPAQYLVRTAIANQGGKALFEGAPWRRCIEGVKSGAFDGVIGAAANVDFQSFMRFPQKAGQPDPGAALTEATHLAVRRKGSRPDWDGQRFANLGGAVYYPAGTAIVADRLKRLGVAGNDNTKTAEQLMQMLVRGRIELAVLRADDVTELLKQSEFVAALETLKVPVVASAAFFAVRQSAYDSAPGFMNAVWQDIARLRSSPEFGEVQRRQQQRSMASAR